MKTYRFYIKMYRDVDAENPEEAETEIDKVMDDDSNMFYNPIKHFVVKEGVHYNDPEEKT